MVKIFSRSLDLVIEDLATGTGLEVSNMQAVFGATGFDFSSGMTR